MSPNTVRREDGFSLVDVMAAVLVIGIVSAIAVPVTGSSLAAQRFRGDGQAVSNLVALAKMRAASQFSRSRVFADLGTGAYGMQVWNKTTAAWVTEGAARQTSRGVTFGFGVVATPPPNTQAAIGFAAPCRADDGTVMANTACIVFNSRGIPIDNAGAPTGGNALYLTDGNGVYGVTVTATPLVRFWWTRAQAAAWVEQQ
jgi:Tfp pilus assembly protein FimT